MNTSKILEQLGYPSNQVKIYLASLKMGEATIAELAENLSMPRTTIAEVLNEMNKNGLMAFYSRKNHKYWVAENPNKLLSSLQEKEANLKNILPQLHAMHFDSGEGKPNIRCYFGTNEIKNMLNDMMEDKHHIMAVVSWDDFIEFLGQDFINDLIEKRKNHFLKMRLITPNSTLAISLKKQDNKELRQTKLLPEHIKIRKSSTFIYGDKVSLLSLNPKQPTGILIHDPNVAYGQSIYFESLWEHCK